MGLRETLSIEKVLFIDKKRIRELTIFAYIKRENNQTNLAAEESSLLVTATFRADTSFYGDNNIIHPTSNILDAISS